VETEQVRRRFIHWGVRLIGVTKDSIAVGARMAFAIRIDAIRECLADHPATVDHQPSLFR